MNDEITTVDGLLFRNGIYIPLPEADKVAREHGFQYAEQLVHHLQLKQEKGPECQTSQ